MNKIPFKIKSHVHVRCRTFYFRFWRDLEVEMEKFTLKGGASWSSFPLHRNLDYNIINITNSPPLVWTIILRINEHFLLATRSGTTETEESGLTSWHWAKESSWPKTNNFMIKYEICRNLFLLTIKYHNFFSSSWKFSPNMGLVFTNSLAPSRVWPIVPINKIPFSIESPF